MNCGFLVTLPVALLIAASCRVGPTYAAPETDLPTSWRFGSGTSGPESIADLPWWKLFEDPKLQECIREALSKNLGLQQAAARIESARGLLRATKATSR